MHGYQGFLGEFAGANNPTCNAAVTDTLTFIQNNADVWLGWSWWAAGPWWGNYMFTLEPTNLGQPSQADRAALAVLQQHVAVKGDYNGNGVVDAADYVYWRKNLNQNVTAGTAADGDASGLVSQPDFDIWRLSFSRTRPSGSGTLDVAVSEPRAIVLFLAA